MSVIDTIGRVLGIVDKAVPDAGLKDEIIRELVTLREDTYRRELDTRTVPWVDAMHKMGRQILSYTTLFVGAWLIYSRPDVDPLTLAAIVAPGGVYNFVKGRGK